MESIRTLVINDIEFNVSDNTNIFRNKYKEYIKESCKYSNDKSEVLKLDNVEAKFVGGYVSDLWITVNKNSLSNIIIVDHCNNSISMDDIINLEYFMNVSCDVDIVSEKKGRIKYFKDLIDFQYKNATLKIYFMEKSCVVRIEFDIKSRLDKIITKKY